MAAGYLHLLPAVCKHVHTGLNPGYYIKAYIIPFHLMSFIQDQMMSTLELRYGIFHFLTKCPPNVNSSQPSGLSNISATVLEEMWEILVEILELPKIPKSCMKVHNGVLSLNKALAYMPLLLLNCHKNLASNLPYQQRNLIPSTTWCQAYMSD